MYNGGPYNAPGGVYNRGRVALVLRAVARALALVARARGAR